MHRRVKHFIQLFSKNGILDEPIYEFGSRKMIGQEESADISKFFPNLELIGVDYIDGIGVDQVLDIRDISKEDNSIGTLLCTEVLEHVDEPFKAISEIRRVLKPNGVLLLTCPFKLPIHGSPYDYWRFTPQGFEVLLKDFKNIRVSYGGFIDNPDTVVALASEEVNLYSDDYNRLFSEWELKWQKVRLVERYKAIRIIKNLLCPPIFIDSNYEFLLRKDYKLLKFTIQLIILFIPNILNPFYFYKKIMGS